jgi:hypothetical protein
MNEITTQNRRDRRHGNRLSRKVAALAVSAAALTGSFTLATATPASADVVVRQPFSKDGLHCGGQERITGSSDLLGVPLKQHSWIYYNCGDQSVHRKSDVKNDFDGDCIGIGPGQALVIDTKNSVFDDVYRGSKPC